MGRRPCCEKVGLNRGAWTIEEDNKLTNFILNNGIVCWRRLPKLAGLLRCGKSCRLRWVNYLRPDVKRGEFTDEEDDQIIQLHSRFGNKWSKIASHFPGRTDNEIKNHWNTRIKKKLKHLGLDPWTHKPIEHNQNKNSTEQASSIKNKNKVEIKHQEHLGHDESNVEISELSPNSENKGGLVDDDNDDNTREEETMLIDYDFDMLWKSLEMVANDNELQDSNLCIGHDQHNKSTFLDEELQQWLNQLETRLFSDVPNDFDEISVGNY